MNLFRLNTVLVALLLAFLVGTWALPRNPSHRNLEVMPDMQYSPAYDAYSPNPNFANGQTLQEPPAGTVARGERVLHYTNSVEDAVRAGAELTSPVAGDDPQILAAGQEVYRVYCTMCHGPQGLGDGPVPKRGYPPPPSLLTGKSLQMKDGQMFHILTYGQGGMAPYASQISPEDRWAAIAYVRDMQAKAAAAGATPNPANPGREPANQVTTEPAAEQGDKESLETGTQETETPETASDESETPE